LQLIEAIGFLSGILIFKTADTFGLTEAFDEDFKASSLTLQKGIYCDVIVFA
jgi:hypothetical protein